MFKVASENITTATAMPFCTFNDIKTFSSKEKFIPLKEKSIAINLIIKYNENKIKDFIKNIKEKGIATISPIRTKTSISREVENIEENSCN